MSNWKTFSDKFTMKLCFTLHCSWFISQEFASDAYCYAYFHLVYLSVAGSLYGNVAPYKKMRKPDLNKHCAVLWLKTQQQMNHASDSSPGKWWNREKEGKQKERDGTDFTVFRLLTLPENTFHSKLLMHPLFIFALLLFLNAQQYTTI